MTSAVATTRVGTALLVRMAEITNRTLVLPLLVFFPTSRCNSHCVSCDWWRHDGRDDLSIDEINVVADAAARLGTRLVVFSGGEPLLRPDLFAAAAAFRHRGAALHLLTSGVLLEEAASGIPDWFERVVVSLDAADRTLYRTIRGIDGLGRLEGGIRRLRSIAPTLPIHARATLHRANYRELPRLIDYAHELGLNGISFLAADVSSPSAFGRAAPGPRRLTLDVDEIAEFSQVIERAVLDYAADFDSRFVAESPDKLRRLPKYYAALRGAAPFPSVSCNAPWMSAVVEANGVVRPCFFHEAVGNVREAPLETIVRTQLRAFRASLDVGADLVCSRCVCSLKMTWRNAPW